jgi:hypothetical protein
MDEGTYFAYASLPPSQGQPVLDDGQTGSLSPDGPLYPFHPQVNVEARSHILCDAVLMVN